MDREKQLARFAARACGATGMLYVLAVCAFLVRDKYGPGPMLGYMMLFVGLASILGFTLIPILRNALRGSHEGALLLAASIGYLGYGAAAIDLLTPSEVNAFGLGDLDRLGVMTYGAVGVWLLMANFIALSQKTWPSWMAAIGGLLGAAHIIIFIGLFTQSEVPLEIGASICLVSAPVWYIALARWFHRSAMN